MDQMVKALQKRKSLVFGTFKSGFTLIEILVVIAIIAIISAVVVPNIGKFVPRYQQEQAISRLNALVQIGWQRALSSHTLHRVVFDMSKQSVILESEVAQKKEGDVPFTPVNISHLTSRFEWPKELEIKQFFIEGFDEMSRFAGNRKTAQLWFYIVPNGLTQDVIINITHTSQASAKEAKQLSLVLNPFKAEFEVHDAFQKP